MRQVTQSGSSSLRRSSMLDILLGEANRALQVLSGVANATRPNPADLPTGTSAFPDATTSDHSDAHAVTGSAASPVETTAATALVAANPLADPTAAEPPALSPADERHAAGLMRVNHVGEICAQALYRGQAVLARDPDTKALLNEAAAEEIDHLSWLNQRLSELNSRPSLLNPLWYAGSFMLGVTAARAGKRYNLGFMAETEKQVGRHLESHLRKLPEHDVRSRKIVERMWIDETGHQQRAEAAGGVPLPAPVKLAMRGMSKIMTSTAYWI